MRHLAYHPKGLKVKEDLWQRVAGGTPGRNFGPQASLDTDLK
jgi:hypothetical protein